MGGAGGQWVSIEKSPGTGSSSESKNTVSQRGGDDQVQLKTQGINP